MDSSKIPTSNTPAPTASIRSRRSPSPKEILVEHYKLPTGLALLKSHSTAPRQPLSEAANWLLTIKNLP